MTVHSFHHSAEISYAVVCQTITYSIEGLSDGQGILLSLYIYLFACIFVGVAGILYPQLRIDGGCKFQ